MNRMSRPALFLTFAVAATSATGAGGQETQQVEPQGSGFSWGFEVKAHYRYSEDLKVAPPFPFGPDDIPVGQEGVFLRTVNPGDHVEISVLHLFVDYEWSPGLVAHAKVDFLDLYDRNPTSEADEVVVDEAWIRFGRESAPAIVPEDPGVYLKVGKFSKFEKQDDRHLESYGLAATAFNRFSDIGLELGADLGRHVYVKASLTAGNPVFMRDPNVLAGDPGTQAFLNPLGNPDPKVNVGFPILYDTQIQDLDVDGDFEYSAGLGFRFGDVAGERGVDVLLFGNEREMAETVEIEGSFYGGDLDLLRGPLNMFPFPIDDDKKTEVGGNVWVYSRGFSFFGQFVDQEVAGLPRIGFEAEVAYSFGLPLKWATGGKQVLTFIQPAARFSQLDNDFAIPEVTPSPSFGWDWEKIDVGLRLGIISGVDATLEYVRNEFELARGTESYDEVLTTLRWRR